MIDSNRDNKGDIPTDNDELAAADSVNEAGKIKKEDPPNEITDSRPEPNPPRTTTGKWFTTPKFGSAGSGGFEIEPGLDKD
jgi:hypothetical protein